MDIYNVNSIMPIDCSWHRNTAAIFDEVGSLVAIAIQQLKSHPKYEPESSSSRRTFPVAGDNESEF